MARRPIADPKGVTLIVEFLAITNKAPTVSVDVMLLADEARENKSSQALASPALPPLELMQADRMFAKVSSRSDGTAWSVGAVKPRLLPIAVVAGLVPALKAYRTPVAANLVAE